MVHLLLLQPGVISNRERPVSGGGKKILSSIGKVRGRNQLFVHESLNHYTRTALIFVFSVLSFFQASLTFRFMRIFNRMCKSSVMTFSHTEVFDKNMLVVITNYITVMLVRPIYITWFGAVYIHRSLYLTGNNRTRLYSQLLPPPSCRKNGIGKLNLYVIFKRVHIS